MARDDSERGSTASVSGFLRSASGRDRPPPSVDAEDPANIVGKLGAVVIALIIAFGVTGNLLVIVAVVKTRLLRRSYNVLIASLSATDLAFVVLIMPLYADSYANRLWRYSTGFCLFETFFGTMAIVTTGLHIGLIAVNRCCLVACPRRYPTMASRPALIVQVGLAWTVAVAVVLPGAAFGWNATVEYSDQVGRCNYVRSASRPTLFLVFGTGFVGPCAVMCCCYVIIWNLARKSGQRVTKYSREVNPTPAPRVPSNEQVAVAIRSTTTSTRDICQSLDTIGIARVISSEVSRPTSYPQPPERHDSISELPISVSQIRVLPEKGIFIKPDFRLDQEFRDLKPYIVVRETESLKCPIPLETLCKPQFQVSSSSEKDCLIYPRLHQVTGPQDILNFLAISNVKTVSLVASSYKESDLSCEMISQASKLISQSECVLPKTSQTSFCHQAILFNNQTLDEGNSSAHRKEPRLTSTRNFVDNDLQLGNNASVLDGSNTTKNVLSPEKNN